MRCEQRLDGAAEGGGVEARRFLCWELVHPGQRGEEVLVSGRVGEVDVPGDGQRRARAWRLHRGQTEGRGERQGEGAVGVPVVACGGVLALPGSGYGGVAIVPVEDRRPDVEGAEAALGQREEQVVPRN